MTATPARRAAAVLLSDAELSTALDLWRRLTAEDGTLTETVARALYEDDLGGVPDSGEAWPAIPETGRGYYRKQAAVAIEAVRGEGQ